MGKKIIYILPLICIITLTCKTSDLDILRPEIKHISNNNRIENRIIYAYLSEDEYNPNVGSFFDNNNIIKLPENIKFLDISDHPDDDNIKTKYKPKKVISQPSINIIVNKQKNRLNTSNGSPLINEDKPFGSIDLSLSSDTVHKLNSESSYFSSMKKRKNIDFIKLRHLEHKTDGIANKARIEKSKNNQARYNTSIINIIIFCIYSILFFFTVNFLIKRTK